MQPEKIRLVQRWTTTSKRDLLSAAYLAERDPPLLDTCVYHCQQSAEKVLKAYLTWHDRPLIRTHNLLELVATCAEIDDSFTNLRDAAVTLNPYAFRFRYPGSEIEPSSTQAEAAISFAEQVYAFVMDRLPEGSQPGEETQ